MKRGDLRPGMAFVGDMGREIWLIISTSMNLKSLCIRVTYLISGHAGGRVESYEGLIDDNTWFEIDML